MSEQAAKKRVFVSGPQNVVELDSSRGLIRIGERLNVRGSKKVREAVENESGIVDFDALEEVVNEQVRELGVEIIDVCMDSNQVDTVKVLPEVVHRLTMDFPAAMCLDSFDVEALIKAVESYPGRPIVNSISLEDVEEGLSKIDAICPRTVFHNPIYIALCTGPKGPAATADEKVALTKEIMIATARHGVRPDQLMIDMNVFPIGAESEEGMNFALETLNAISRIKALHPDLMTSMGVGNLTNGLAKKPYMRTLLTSVFLHEARKHGLDAAIINPNHYVPVDSLDAGDVKIAEAIIFNRDMEAFAKLEEIAELKAGRTVKKRSNYEDLEDKAAICQKVLDGYKDRRAGELEYDNMSFTYADRIVPQVVEVLKTGLDPLIFINEHLMEAMKKLGDGFAAGDVSLPHLLKAADVMKQVMGFLENYMKRKAGSDVHEGVSYKATVVLGTVYQDVHSIGKDLARTLLENYGYRVIDLGVQVPLQKFIDAIKEHKAQALGLSALLVQTSNHMITLSKMLRDEGLEHIDILIGGAPVNWRHAGYVAMAGEDDVATIASNVFYCPSGMEGVNHMNALVGIGRENYLIENRKRLKDHFLRAQKQAEESSDLLNKLSPRKIDLSQYQAPAPSSYTASKVMSIGLGILSSHLDKKSLFGLNWRMGGKNDRQRRGESDEKMQKLFERWISQSDHQHWINPKAAYGLYPCKRVGSEVVVFDPADKTKELTRFNFSRTVGSTKEDTICAADYFLDQDFDCIGVQITTAGDKVNEVIDAFKAKNDSESAHYLQGLSDRVAEDLADFVHKELRSLCGVGEKIGTRYSPGYPAIRDLDNNRKILELLQADKKLGIRITEAGEFHPTGSTAAVVCFFSGAHYD